MPKLIGSIRLPIPRIRDYPDGFKPGYMETIQTVAIDETGTAWGLVERTSPIDGEPNMFRLSLDRWVRFSAIPFDETEEVRREVWMKG